MILEVRIQAPPGGVSRTLQFTKSPVRIGRNQLNDISLEDPFVSEWHGTIRFDQNSIAYFDLGSTNGTLLDGQRLNKNVATQLSDQSRLQLGLLQLLVSRVAEQPSSASSAGKGPGSPASPSTGPLGTGTMEWNRADLELGSSTRPAPMVIGRPASASTPPPVSRSPSGRFPPLADLRSEANRSGAEPGRTVEAETASQQRRLLEAFAEAFIGLRKGYEQFGAEVGVRTISGSTTLHRARSRAELLDYLLQPNADMAAITRDLIAIFADFGIHHIAMIQGVTEGARAVLGVLNPRANEVDAGGRLFSGAKTKNQWKTYLERFDQMLSNDNELHATLFGNEFARAYASVTLGEGGKPQKTGGIGAGSADTVKPKGRSR